MLRTVLLVPVQDNDGKDFTRGDWDELETRLILAFGGYTMPGQAEGAWSGEGGHVYRDVSYQYVVSLTTCRQLPAWLEIVEWALVHFHQEAVYVEIAGVPEVLSRKARE